MHVYTSHFGVYILIIEYVGILHVTIIFNLREGCREEEGCRGKREEDGGGRIKEGGGRREFYLKGQCE